MSTLQEDFEKLAKANAELKEAIAQELLIMAQKLSSFSVICKVPGCFKPIRANGLCGGHYYQHKQGKQLTPLRPYHHHKD